MRSGIANIFKDQKAKKKREKKDKLESLATLCQGSFALLRCFYDFPWVVIEEML